MKIPAFRITIVGDTMDEIRARAKEIIGDEPVKEQEDFLERAYPTAGPVPATEESVPSAPVSIPKVNSTATPAPATPNDYGVDSRGLPWDERIHSTTQGKNKDGSWRNRRGVEDGYVRTVEAELATKVRGMQAETMVMTSHPPVSHPVPPVPASVIQFPSAAQPAAPVLPPTPPPVVVPSAHTLATFKATLVPTLAKLVTDGKLTQPYMADLCKHYNVQMLHMVNDEQLAELFDVFVHYKFIVKAE